MIGFTPNYFTTFKKDGFIPFAKKSKIGQSYSLQCGLRYAQKLEAEAVIVLLADQPLIAKDMIDKIIIQFEQNKRCRNTPSFIAAKHLDVYCPPVLFSDHMFEALYRLQGDKGARHIIQNKINEGSFIEFAHFRFLFDVDTKEDYMITLETLKSI